MTGSLSITFPVQLPPGVIMFLIIRVIYTAIRNPLAECSLFNSKFQEIYERDVKVPCCVLFFWCLSLIQSYIDVAKRSEDLNRLAKEFVAYAKTGNSCACSEVVVYSFSGWNHCFWASFGWSAQDLQTCEICFSLVLSPVVIFLNVSLHFCFCFLFLFFLNVVFSKCANQTGHAVSLFISSRKKMKFEGWR